MKLLALLFLVGCAFGSSSEWRWQTGQEYTFGYSGRLLTGIPELSATQFSGMGITCNVVVTVKGDRRLVVTVAEPEFVRVNGKLRSGAGVDGDDGSNWRKVVLPEMEAVTGEQARFLAMPVVFGLSNGEITEMQVSEREPEWSVNFKKALVLNFQTKLDASSWELNENRFQRESTNMESYWKVKEESIDGVCENTYEVNELPAYMIRDRPELIPLPVKCPADAKYFELTKTRNVDSCEKRATFAFHQPGKLACAAGAAGGNCDDMWTRSSVTRYVACGSSRSDLTIQSIVNEGELNQNLLGFKTERFVTGSKANFTLKSIRPSSGSVPMPVDPVTVKTMMYEYSLKGMRSGSGSGSGSSPLVSGSQEEMIRLTQAGRVASKSTEEISQVLKHTQGEISASEIMPQLKQLIREVVMSLNMEESSSSSSSSNSYTEKHINMKILSIARGFGILNDKHAIKSIYDELLSSVESESQSYSYSGQSAESTEQKKHTIKNIIFDTVLMSGTPQSIYFLKDMIKSGEMTKLQIASMFFSLPRYVITPTEELLESLFHLVTGEQRLRSCEKLFSTVVLGYSNLIQKACLSDSRKSSYPIWVFGDFCSERSPVVNEMWIKWLVQQLQSSGSGSTSSHTVERKNMIITAMGSLTHKSVFPELIPFVQGSVEGTTPMTRYLAIFALAKAGSKKPETVIPIIYSVFSNPAESTEARIAAFNCLLRLNPSLSTMQKIAASTWFESDMEVLKTVNIALYTLAKQTETMTVKSKFGGLTMAGKAYAVFPTIKKTAGIMPSSASIFSSDKLTKLGVGFESVTGWTGSNSTFLPVNMFTEIKYFLDRLEMTPLSMGVRFEGAENIYEKIGEILAPNGEEASQVERQLRQQLNSQWVKIVEQLRIKSRQSPTSDKMSGAFFATFLESSSVFLNFDKITSEMLREKISPLLHGSNPLKELKEKVCGRTPLNFQKTIDLTPTVFLIPSDLGLPINIEVHAPVTVSFRGAIDVDCSLRVPSVSVEAKALYTSQLTGFVGTTCPFTKEFLATGVEEETIVSLPAHITIKLDVSNGKLSFNLKPLTTSGSSPVDLLHFHMRPFTVTKKVADLSPLTASSTFKVIHSEQEPKTIRKSFGDYLGLSMDAILETESVYTDANSVVQVLKMYNYNPMNVLRFGGWTSAAMSQSGMSSLRKHTFSVKYHPGQSTTKEITTEIKIGFATKSHGQSEVKYHTIAVKENSGSGSRSTGSSSIKQTLEKLIPYGIESHPIGEQTRHQSGRQQKISEVLEQLRGVESKTGLAIFTSVILRGNRVRTWTYKMVATSGKDESSRAYGKITSKWNVQLETSETAKKVCLKGHVQMPVLPLWSLHKIRETDIKFEYSNVFGYGNDNCDDHKVVVSGIAKRSEEQKQHSEESKEGKECRRSGVQSGRSCEIARQQARTVDEVDFKIEYINVTPYMKYVEKKATEGLKALLWPYLKDVLSTGSSHSPRSYGTTKTTTARILFKQSLPTFDLIIKEELSGEQQIVFKNVRLPYPLSVFMPLKAGVSNIELSLNKLTGGSFSPVCKINEETMTTFDNKTVHLNLDGCFHLLTADCSKSMQFGVLARAMKTGGRREMRVFLGDSEIRMIPSERHAGSFSHIEMILNGETVSTPVNAWKSLVGRDSGKIVGSVFRGRDNTLKIKSSAFGVELTFDGERIAITASPLMKNKLCGLCGDFNMQKKADVTGPSGCVYSKASLAVAAYRLPCSQHGESTENSLPFGIKQQLRREEQICHQYKEIPTKVTKSFKIESGKCSQQKHVVLVRPGSQEVCISKEPVKQCGGACRAAQPARMEAKPVGFACLPEGRLAQHYNNKAQEGKDLTGELRSMAVKFTTKLQQPSRCVPTISINGEGESF